MGGVDQGDQGDEGDDSSGIWMGHLVQGNRAAIGADVAGRLWTVGGGPGVAVQVVGRGREADKGERGGDPGERRGRRRGAEHNPSLIQQAVHRDRLVFVAVRVAHSLHHQRVLPRHLARDGEGRAGAIRGDHGVAAGPAQVGEVALPDLGDATVGDGSVTVRTVGVGGGDTYVVGALTVKPNPQ